MARDLFASRTGRPRAGAPPAMPQAGAQAVPQPVDHRPPKSGVAAPAPGNGHERSLPAGPAAASVRTPQEPSQALLAASEGRSGQRVLYCWLPRFATDRLTRRQPVLAGLPFAAVQHQRGRRVAVAVNAMAEQSSVRAGQSLADARSLCPTLMAVDADPAADSRLLLHLARWCTRYTPWVTPDIPAADDPFALFEGALLLDISGCAHLMGGEDALAVDLAQRLQGFGFAVRCAIADTPGAAWAWARYGNPGHPVIPAGTQTEWLEPLPAAALRLRDEDAETLLRLGIATVGDLMALPRAAVANRFQAKFPKSAKGQTAAGVLYRLDQALGAAPESVSPLPAPAEFSVRQHYAEPIGTPEGVAAAFERLLLALGRKLEAAGMGVRTIEFTVMRNDDTLDSARIGVSRATRDAAHLARLFAPRLESLDPDPGVETVLLTAVSVEPFTIEQQVIQRVNHQSIGKLSHEDKPAGAAVDNSPARSTSAGSALAGVSFDSTPVGELIDRLANRLGRDAILRARPVETALPETQTDFVPALDTMAGDPLLDWSAWRTTDRVAGPPLPVRLLEAPEAVEAHLEAASAHRTAPPARFVWRRQACRVLHHDGPARRLGRWWHGETAIRDYWQVTVTIGDHSAEDAPARLWLYRDPAEGWHVQGMTG